MNIKNPQISEHWNGFANLPSFYRGALKDPNEMKDLPNAHGLLSEGWARKSSLLGSQVILPSSQ